MTVASTCGSRRIENEKRQKNGTQRCVHTYYYYRGVSGDEFRDVIKKKETIVFKKMTIPILGTPTNLRIDSYSMTGPSPIQPSQYIRRRSYDIEFSSCAMEEATYASVEQPARPRGPSVSLMDQGAPPPEETLSEHSSRKRKIPDAVAHDDPWRRQRPDSYARRVRALNDMLDARGNAMPPPKGTPALPPSSETAAAGAYSGASDGDDEGRRRRRPQHFPDRHPPSAAESSGPGVAHEERCYPHDACESVPRPSEAPRPNDTAAGDGGEAAEASEAEMMQPEPDESEGPEEEHDEDQRRERTRERNREHARATRARKKARIAELQRRVDQLHAESSQLRQQLEALTN